MRLRKVVMVLVAGLALPGCYEAAQRVDVSRDGGQGSDVRLTYVMRPLYVPEDLLASFTVLINGTAYPVADSTWGLAAVYETTMPAGARYPTVPLSIEIVDSASGELMASKRTDGFVCRSRTNPGARESVEGVVEVRFFEILGYDMEDPAEDRDSPWSLGDDCRFCINSDPDESMSWCI